MRADLTFLMTSGWLMRSMATTSLPTRALNRRMDRIANCPTASMFAI
jgi:hypothetical protein